MQGIKKRENYYEFDIKKEYTMYASVGLKNSKFLTYTQWEEHIKSILERYIRRTRKNFKHYLIGKKRVEENKLQTIDSVWMPLNIFILTVFLTFVFAFANMASSYNANCTEIINNYAVEDKEELYEESLNSLEQNFDESVQFYGVFSLIVLLLGLWLYQMGKSRRRNLFDKKKFYQDVISIIEDFDE